MAPLSHDDDRQRTDDGPRRTAEIDDDTLEVLPPEARLDGDVPQAVEDAVGAALAEEPNAVDAPILRDGSGRQVAVLDVRFNELPATGPDGDLEGWMAPYRARERFLAALRPHLDGLEVEVERDHRLGFYEVSR